MIDPDIWEDEKFTQLDFCGRLLFIGLITLSNDAGKLRGNSKLLKSKIFPYDSNDVKLEQHLRQLTELGIIQAYTINAERYIKINNWLKYQTLTYIGKDGIPDPPTTPQDKISKDKISKEAPRQPQINPEETLKKPLTNTEEKIKYAEFVSMKPSQYDLLVAAHGEKAAKRMIEILDNYKGSKGKTYKDDYRAILSWVVDKFKEELTKRPDTPHAKQLLPGHSPKGMPESVKEIMKGVK